MKLRVQESSITLRLSPEEIQSLAVSRSLCQKSVLPGGQLDIRVDASDTEDMAFHYQEGCFAFSIPSVDLESWANTSKMGYRRNYGDLLVVIEKDLPRRRK